MKDIKTDSHLIDVINELKHRLKGGHPYSIMRKDFDSMLNEFIKRHKLDSDPHAFATIRPKTLAEVFQDEDG